MSTELAERTAPILQAARELYQEMAGIDARIRRDYDDLLCAAWALGGLLRQLKEIVGHGRWLFWLGGNWKDLGEDRAQRAMQFFVANEKLSNPANLRDFEVDSVRRYLGGYLPAKLRPQLQGDQRLAPVISFDAGTNRFAAFFHRIKEGHVQPPKWEVVQPQVKLILDGLRDVYGPDRLAELLT